MDQKEYDRLENAYRKAEDSDCMVDVATSNVLQLDLDGLMEYQTFVSQANLMIDQDLLPPGTRFTVSPSRSGNLHVRVIAPPNTEWGTQKRILMQALLGSDLKREALSLSRWQHCVDAAILLFVPQFTVEMPWYFFQGDIDNLNARCQKRDPITDDVIF